MKFFVRNIPFYILKENINYPFEERSCVLGNISVSKIIYIYQQLKEDLLKGVNSIVVSVKNYDATVEDLKMYFEFRKASGGLVVKKNRFLCIYRFDKWDLPKGHIEKNESKENAALREVIEETGVKASITNFLTHTLHTYVLKDRKDILKKTYWFKMKCQDDDHLSPDEKEGIKKVVWLKKKEIINSVFPNTYASIREVFELSKKINNKNFIND